MIIHLNECYGRGCSTGKSRASIFEGTSPALGNCPTERGRARGLVRVLTSAVDASGASESSVDLSWLAASGLSELVLGGDATLTIPSLRLRPGAALGNQPAFV